jgi:dephospho-CoA kinase
VIVIGLTGSIAMGKSTVAAMFREAGAPVFDSDEAVHRLYGGPAAAEIDEAFPGVLTDGAVDRGRLSDRVLNDPVGLARLEAIVHPKVAASREEFLKGAVAAGRRVAVVDIPLLFEAGADKSVDLVAVVSAPEPVQKERALLRKGMTEARFAAIVAKQIPDREKRRRAHFVIETDCPFEMTRAKTRGLLRSVAGMTGRVLELNARNRA